MNSLSKTKEELIETHNQAVKDEREKTIEKFIMKTGMTIALGFILFVIARAIIKL
jgi:hypothetical protein